MWRSVALASLLLVQVQPALANGRAPGTSTINFQRGNEDHIVAGMTFGLVKSDDGGATWTWQCEDAIGYGGTYDPDYAYTPSGSLFATTFDGLKSNRDGCVYEPSVLSPVPTPDTPGKFFSAIALGPDGAVYAAAADPSDGAIYKSTDDGQTFPTKTSPGELNDWWQSIEVAPTNAQVVYLSGYRLQAGAEKVHLLFKSTDGGASFQPLPVDDFEVMPNSTLEIAGISKNDPDLVFVRVTLSDNTTSDALYRSDDGGQTFTKILEEAGSIAFTTRKNGQIVAGTQALGAFVANEADASPTFTPLDGPPHINCLAENAAGEVWACTQNYGSQAVPSDEFGIMKSTDLATWTGVLKYQEIQLPTACPSGTTQHDFCDVQLWCGLCAQLGCDAKRECGDVIPPDAGPPTGTPDEPGGCCQTGDGGAPVAMGLAIVVGGVLVRRRKRRA